MKDTTTVVFENKKIDEILEGAKKVATAVATTMGPQGTTVLIRNPSGYHKITKDGVTVANSISLKDPYQDIGCTLIKDTAKTTVVECGDGTTTSSVIAYNMLKEGVKFLKTLENSRDIKSFKQGILDATEEVLSALDEAKTEISTNGDQKSLEQLINIATISSNGDDQIGELVGGALHSVGKDGTISVEKSFDHKSHFVKTPGYKFSRGILNNHFITEMSSYSAEYENPVFILSEEKINSFGEITPILEKVQQLNRPVVIIAEDYDPETLGTLIANKQQGALKIVAIKAPGYGNQMKQQLEDIANLVNSKILSIDLNVRPIDITLEDLEKTGADKISVGQKETIIINGHGFEDTSKYVESLKQRLEKMNTDKSSYDKADFDSIKKRINTLINGIGVLKIGAHTETQMNELIDRVDDALGATKAAIDDGIIPGGGNTLAIISEIIKENPMEFFQDKYQNPNYKMGVNTVLKACTAPLYQIAENSGAIPMAVLNQVLKHNNLNMGFNAQDEDIISGSPDKLKYNMYNLIEFGIIDPVKVTKSALKNASSVISTFLTTKVLVVGDSD